MLNDSAGCHGRGADKLSYHVFPRISSYMSSDALIGSNAMMMFDKHVPRISMYLILYACSRGDPVGQGQTGEV